MDEFFKATMFVPAMMAPRLSADPGANVLTKREWRNFGIKGRLKDGVGFSQAEAELVSLHEGNFARYQIRPSEFEAWQQVWGERKKL